MKKAVILIAALALMIAAGSANAQRWDYGGPMMGPPGEYEQGRQGQRGDRQGGEMGYGYPEGYYEGEYETREYGTTGDYGYGLNEEQAGQYREIYNKYAKELYEMRSEMFTKLEKLNNMLWSDEREKAEVDSLVQEINNLRAKMFEKRVAMKMELGEKDLPMSLSCPGGPGSCPGGGQGMYGRGYGRGMRGPGMHGRGMGPGYYGQGMGPGMMGPGHMGRGRMGPRGGYYDEGYGQQGPRGQYEQRGPRGQYGRGMMGPGMMGPRGGYYQDGDYGQMGPRMQRGWGYMPYPNE